MASIRYIRDWVNGSTANTSHHWVEIQAIDNSGVNIALGKSSPHAYITDGSTDSALYYGNSAAGPLSVTVDLGAVYNINSVKVWHYYTDGRTYYATKTEVSYDGVTWDVIFDSAVSGTYAETSAGRTYSVNNLTKGPKAELLASGELLVAGDVNTRLPVVTDGLVAFYPFDGLNTGGDVLTNGLVHHYKLDEDTLDRYGGKHGTNNGAVMVPGNKQMCYSFNGTNYIRLASDINTGNIAFTVSAWVWVDNTGTACILSNWSGGPVYNSICVYNGKISYWHYNAQWLYEVGTSNVANSTWHFLTWVNYTNQTMDLYVDGVKEATVPSTTGTNAPVNQIGKHWSTANACKIQDVRYYNRSLSLSEILTLKSMYDPAYNVSTSLTYDGLGVAEATTNLFANPFLTTDSTGWAEYDNVAKASNLRRERVYDCPLMEVEYAMAIDIANLTGNSGCGFYLSSQSHTLGVYYTKSIWVKTNIDGVIATATNSNIGYSGSTYTLKAGEWVQIQATHYNATTTQSDALHFAFWHPNGDSFTVWATGGQFEARAFATYPVKGTRNAGLFSIPSYNWNTSFTIMLDCKMMSTVGYRMMGGAWGSWYFSWDNNSTNVLLVSWVDSTQKSVYTSAIAGVDCRNWNRVGFSYDSVNKIVKIYANGVEVASGTGNFTTTYSTYTAIGSLNHGDHSYKLNGTIKNYCIYNRVLTADEVKQIGKSTFELKSNGNLIASQLKTQPILPARVAYFPLGCDGKEISKIFSPSIESGVVYQEGGCWVGGATSNLWVGGTYSWTEGVGVITRNVSKGGMYPGLEVIKVQSSDGNVFSTIPWTTNSTIKTPGFTYTHSVYAYLESGSYVGIGQHWNPWNYSKNNRRYIPKNTWVRIDTTITTDHATNVQVALEYCTDGVAYFTAPQYEERSFPTPFVNGSRATGVLCYTPSQLGLALDTSDWTVCCFIKPVPSLMASTGTRYNPLEVGNYYKVGTTSISMFHQSYANDLNGVIYDGQAGVSAPGRLNMVAGDMQDWLLVGFRMTGTTLDMFAFGNVSGMKKTSVTKAWTTPIYDRVYVGGYDWASGNYKVKDLVIAKRALTDAELTSMFKEKMTQPMNDKLQILDSIRSGQVL